MHPNYRYEDQSGDSMTTRATTIALLIGSIRTRQLDRLGIGRRRFEVLSGSEELVALFLELANLVRETAGSGLSGHVFVNLLRF